MRVFRVNLTKDEINSLSVAAAKQVLNEIQLQAITEKPVPDFSDSLKYYSDVVPELKIAFPYLDTLKAGVLVSFTSKNIADTMPVYFYKTKINLNTSRKNQLYRYLVLRTRQDTVALFPF